MSLSLDPEIAEALAPMAGAMADTTPPAVGDVATRRALWEPIIGAAGTAQPIPADVKTSEHPSTPSRPRSKTPTGPALAARARRRTGCRPDRGSAGPGRGHGARGADPSHRIYWDWRDTEHLITNAITKATIGPRAP